MRGSGKDPNASVITYKNFIWLLYKLFLSLQLLNAFSLYHCRRVSVFFIKSVCLIGLACQSDNLNLALVFEPHV